MSPFAAGRVRRTDGRLADGRQIFYYDDTEPYLSGSRSRVVPDRRDLPALSEPSTLRFDQLSGEWVAIAAHRNERTFLPPADECPLCPTGRGTVPSEIPADDYDVVVFENRFPSLRQLDGQTPQDIDGEELWPERSGFGRCEVVCFTSDHDASFASLSPARARTVIEAWADRTRELTAVPGIEQVFVFENRGEEIGVTLRHPHGQIYGYGYLPARTERILERCAAHRSATGGNLLRDLLAAERDAGTRVVVAGDAWTAYVPAAARWPVEVHLAPHRDVADLDELDDAERDELAVVYLDLLQRCDRYYEGPEQLPYIAGWHQAPTGDRRELGRLHLQLFSLMRAPGVMKYLAGSESAMGAWINDSRPEQVAARLREVGA